LSIVAEEISEVKDFVNLDGFREATKKDSILYLSMLSEEAENIQKLVG